MAARVNESLGFGTDQATAAFNEICFGAGLEGSGDRAHHAGWAVPAFELASSTYWRGQQGA